MNKDSIYICPAAARRKLKYAEQNRQPVYIYGMTGYGKTSLAEHYLGKKLYQYIDAEKAGPEIFDRLPEGAASFEKGSIVVIDNLQFADKPVVSVKLPELLRNRNCWFILISRAKCPDYLMAFKLKGAGFIEITEEDLSLSAKEEKEFFEETAIPLDAETLGAIRRLSRGHGMWLHILAGLLEQGIAADGGPAVFNKDVYARSLQILWDYVETEVYDRWDPYYEENICKLSIVESFSKELAVYLTGNSQIELLLKYSMETGNFLTIGNDEYVFDLMVRESMRRRLEKRFDRMQRDELYSIAGRYYRQHGEYRKALELFKSCNNTMQIKDILVELSRQQPASSRIYEYKSYFCSLSDEEIALSPDLMCQMSMIYSLTMNVEKSEYWYGRLKQLSVEGSSGQQKSAANYLSYLNLALPHRGSRNVITVIGDISRQFAARKICLSEFSVTGNSLSNMNGGKDFCEWSRHDQELAASIGKMVSFVLGDFGKGLVELCLAESFFEKGMDDYEVIRKTSRGLMQAENGNIEERLVGSGILARLHVRKGHIEDSREIMESFLEKCRQQNISWLIPNINSFLCRLDLYSGNAAGYRKWMEKEAPNEDADFIITERYRYLTKIRIDLTMAKYEQAAALLERMLYYADIYDRPYIMMECRILLAILQYRIGSGEWKSTLQKAYTQAEGYHFVRILSGEAGAVLELYQQAHLTVTDPEFYDQVLVETKNMALFYPDYLHERVPAKSFSDNALQVLRLQAKGLSNEEIAADMNISISTVKYHCRENYEKLGVKNRSAAVAEAQKQKLI